jgi:hypothetical protein
MDFFILHLPFSFLKALLLWHCGVRTSYPLNLDGHVQQFYWIAELGIDGNVGSISAKSDRDTPPVQIGSCRIERVPSISNIYLKPGVQIHWFKRLKLTHHHGGRY